MKFDRPTILYPTLVRGIIKSPLIRCESLTGPELMLPRDQFPDEFRNYGPFEKDGHTYFVCHLQKAATYFSLLYSPFIFHHWVGQPQKQDANGTWIPGSERGNLWLGGYWRTPGFRWQKPDAVSDGTPWIFSGGRIPGTHLD
jgi:hypothetical protein